MAMVMVLRGRVKIVKVVLVLGNSGGAVALVVSAIDGICNGIVKRSKRVRI